MCVCVCVCVCVTRNYHSLYQIVALLYILLNSFQLSIHIKLSDTYMDMYQHILTAFVIHEYLNDFEVGYPNGYIIPC